MRKITHLYQSIHEALLSRLRAAQNTTILPQFLGASATYPGEREGMLTKKREDTKKKEQFTMHASLCGGGDSLKAPGSVAHYLADRSFNLSNDKMDLTMTNLLVHIRSICRI
jgi:hypothetical protein